METISQSSAAELTEDLIIEVLIYLPLISILRFRCVCKSWYKLLDSKFLHTKHKNIKLLVRKQDPINKECIVELKSVIPNEDVVKVKIPFRKSYRRILILGSCNGLILVCYASYVFCVLNPCTAEYKQILGVRQCDREVTSISYGFGYDSKTCDYKLVTIFRPNYFEDFDFYCDSNVEITTLGSDSWTRRICCCIPYELSSGEPGVLLNGALHWLAKKSLSGKPVILSFDMEEESSKKVPLPAAEHMNDYDYKNVDVLRGFLCLLCSVSNVKFEIWEMKDYGVRESWSKKLKIGMQKIMTIGIQSCHHMRRAVSLGNGEILLEIIDKGNSYRDWRADVVRIHLEEKKVYEYMKNISQMVPYVESLVSLFSGTIVGIDEQNDS